jgi:hypothetical protein
MRKQCFIDQIVISVLNRKAINECSLGRWADREAVSYWLMRDPCHRGLHGLRFAPRQNKNRLQRGDPMRADRPEEMMKGDRWFESRSLHRRVRELSVPPEKKSDRAVARCRRSGMTRAEFGPPGVLDRVADQHHRRYVHLRPKSLSIAAEAALDGIYVVRTNLPAGQSDAVATVRAYKSLSGVEHAFRSATSTTAGG